MKFFNRGDHDSEHERIEPGPGWVINPRLKSAKGNAPMNRGILCSQKSPQHDAANNNAARKNNGGTGPPKEDQQNEWESEIKLIFHCKRPGVRKRGTTVQSDILQGEQEFPERLSHIRIFAP